MYHLSCTGHAIFLCMGHTPSLMCRSQSISHAQVTHHLSCTGYAPSLMRRSRTISHAQVMHHLSCIGHAPSLMHRSRTISHAQVTHHLMHKLQITLMHRSHNMPQTHASHSDLYTDHLPACTEHAISASCYYTCFSLCYTTVHASALKTCILGRVLAQFTPQ